MGCPTSLTTMALAAIATGVVMGRDEFDRKWRGALPQVVSVVGRMVADRDLREDVVVEASMRAFRNRDSFDGLSAFATWACAVARHAALDALRRVMRRSTLSSDVTARPDRASIDDGNTGDGFQCYADVTHSGRDDFGVASRDLLVIEAVELARSRHPLYVDMVLRIARGDGTMEEIAESLDLPYGTVKTRALRGRRALRQAARELEV